MVYTGDLKFPAARLMGSSPIPDTTYRKQELFLVVSGGAMFLKKFSS